MENEKYLKITSTVYAFLDLFPDEEPLKIKTKEKALAVLDDLISVGFLPGLEKERVALQAANNIEMLLGYLSLANCQGYLTKLNLIIISEEYAKIMQEIKPIADAYKKKQATIVPTAESASAKTTAPEPRKWNRISDLLPAADVAPKSDGVPKNEALEKFIPAPAPKQTKEKIRLIRLLL